jgi:hypothetical protein
MILLLITLLGICGLAFLLNWIFYEAVWKDSELHK